MIKTIVLAGNRNYTRQLETTIKSILYHNRDVKIYILNQDIMPDWFRKPRKIASMLGSEIIDVKLPEQTVFQDWKKQAHISSIAYARYFIPDYIQEDTVLYLDCDLLINDKLDSLFEQDVREHYIAAIRDANGQGFNTGVLLINNEKWRQEKLKERLIEQSIVTMKEVEEGRFEHFNGDQTIFNQVLQDNWLELGRAYNLQVGHDIVALYNNWQEHLAFNDKPVVIHFTTYRKPWTTLTANRYRDLWWEFHDLEWNQILQHHLGEFELISPLDKEFSCLTLTNSQDLEGIEELVTALPEVVFHIAAWTDMGDKLKKLAVYNNVRLHPQIVPPVLDKLKKSTNLYLDINHGSADENFLKSLQEQEKTLLAFQSTQHGELGQIVFENGKVSFMIDTIKDFKKNGHLTCFRQLPSLTCLTFTASQDIEQLDYLAGQLPNVVFQVAAWTAMGPKLYDLSNRYPNIQLYPAISRDKLDELKEKMDAYLDINLLTSTSDIVAEMAHLSKPILAFYKSQNGNNGQRLYSSEHPERMLADLQKLITKDMLEKPLDIIQVKGIDETLDYIIEHNSSLVRFGDGEVNLMWGLPIPYQNHDLELANQLKHIVGLESDEKLVVCLPDAFDDRFVFTWWATPFWKEHMNVYMDFYKELCKGSWYGSTFISRPYIDYEDKSKAKGQFEKLKSIWENRDILIVEGITSRSGVGNDLFDKVKSVKRIICPSHNAYSVVDNIQEEIMKHAEGRLILCMLGPTAKVLAYHLSRKGYQVLDIGHIDSEYEWMKMGAKTKVKFSHKHTAEYNFDQDIQFIEDETYNSQILVDLSKREV
ncbi:glycosyl transferase 8 family protein [Streptococcus pneumoniae GA40410]|uniref:SP_1767 family glycosyltransferase n=1 Tax=Streptococcus pneumoniae TaxID=1313 RepID=UPI000254B70E|nr:SP_1767 family glycosyltransferase [Streptococcus pneumoniae]EHZ42941.1 glycosyl transferase 8 family protein [Streptococcus pneumoniae GA40410]WDT22487.1 SP_1767 family glycosyltransferase [Streptococcus pneumoniae]WDT24589.1 SP_1767 family glycosyltransferase [Streptococcus pneumoniae]WDT26575.1 SP_1767 family glycosyltransferase [Streptococcus pneumoniae]HEW0297456.1 SP_1767 family glycosyltransferase [Streptococcus pneumoniae]